MPLHNPPGSFAAWRNKGIEGSEILCLIIMFQEVIMTEKHLFQSYYDCNFIAMTSSYLFIVFAVAIL